MLRALNKIDDCKREVTFVLYVAGSVIEDIVLLRYGKNRAWALLPILLSITVSALIFTLVSGTAFAQSDAETIAENYQERLSEFADDPDALKFTQDMIELSRQGATYATSDLPSATESYLNGLQGAGEVFELDIDPQDAEVVREANERHVALISLGMPDAAIIRIIQEAERFGVDVVVRGLHEGSWQAMAARLQELSEQVDIRGIDIDPRIFRTLGVEKVPAFVWLSDDIQPCGTLDCITDAPTHTIISGNVGVEYAFETMGRLPER